MDQLFKGLDVETQLLVGIGAAIAAGCIPCLEKMNNLASEAGIEPKKLKAAAIIGQFVKDQPAGQIKATADRLLGTHLQSAPLSAACPADVPQSENDTCGCGNETASASCGCC
jgi:hypothetical protein